MNIKLSSSTLKRQQKENCTTMRCSIHKDFEIDSICFSKDCLNSSSQLTCAICSASEQPHCCHQNLVFPIYKTSPGFRMLESASNQKFALQIECQKEIILNFVNKLEVTFSHLMNGTIAALRRKLKCLSELPKAGSVFKLCQNIKRQGSIHSKCCLKIINKLKSFEDSCPNPQKQVQSFLFKIIKQELDHSSSLICKLQENVQNTIKKMLDYEGQSIECQYKEQIEKFQLSEKAENTYESLQYSNMEINKKMNDVIDLDSSRINQTRLSNNSFFVQNLQLNNISPINIGRSFQSISVDTPINKLLELSLDDKSPGISVVQLVKQKNQLRKTVLPFGIDIIDDETLAFWKVLNSRQRSSAILFIQQNRGFTHLLFEVIICEFEKFEKFLLALFEIPNITIFHFTFNAINMNILNIFETFPQRMQMIRVGNNYRLLQRLDFSHFFNKTGQQTQFILTPAKRLIINALQNQDSSFNLLVNKIIPAQYLQELVIYGQKNFSKNIVDMKKMRNLKILGLNCLKASSFKVVQRILLGNKALNTFSMINSIGCYTEILTRLKYLDRKRLIHLQLQMFSSASYLSIDKSDFQNLCHHINLQTLILVCVKVFKPRKEIKFGEENSWHLKSIQNLRQLVHLNLYGTRPIFSDFVGMIHPNCRTTLKMLNLGCSYINSQAVSALSHFTNLESLSLDYTEISSQDFLKITKNMANLKNLSIENLNGENISYNQRNYLRQSRYGKITSECLQAMKHKNLVYVNIYRCNQLSGYSWPSFHRLETIRVNDSNFLNKMYRNNQKNGGFSSSILVKFNPKSQLIDEDCLNDLCQHISYQNIIVINKNLSGSIKALQLYLFYIYYFFNQTFCPKQHLSFKQLSFYNQKILEQWNYNSSVVPIVQNVRKCMNFKQNSEKCGKL